MRKATTTDFNPCARQEMECYDALPENLKVLLREMDLPIHAPSVYQMYRYYGEQKTHAMIVEEQDRIKRELSKQ